jgi:hypothetical protein
MSVAVPKRAVLLVVGRIPGRGPPLPAFVSVFVPVMRQAQPLTVRHNVL